MKELSLHLLDIAENSVAANASRIQISVSEDLINDRLHIGVIDNGKGMSPEMVQKVVDPFTTSRTTRKVGLGIPLLKAAAEMCNGYLNIQSKLGAGTKIDIEFQRSHIDRMPIGDLAGTFLQLVVGNPQINWDFEYIVDHNRFEFDDLPIKQELEGISLTEPIVLSFIREEIESGINNLRPESEY
ncbi:MAG: ATP-binding protein [Chloroflexi bacterium HGW-Chloroflexi-10]|nr:MAG: ATP-binding protein [Chloroflexi bacterium HGW-Chloroflexi-10]